MTVTTGIAAALAAPFLEAVGFLEWETHWSKGGGSAFALNLYKCNLAAVGFLIMTMWFDNYDYLVEFQDRAMGGDGNGGDYGVVVGANEKSRVYVPLPEEQLQAMVGGGGGGQLQQQGQLGGINVNFEQPQQQQPGMWSNLGAEEILMQADQRLQQQQQNQGKRPYRQRQQQQINNQQMSRGGRRLQQQQQQPPAGYNVQQWPPPPQNQPPFQQQQSPIDNPSSPQQQQQQQSYPHQRNSHQHHHNHHSRYTTKALLHLILSSLLGIVIGDSAELEALRLIGARRVLVVDTIKPFAAALLGNMLLHEPLYRAAFVGMALTAYGIFLVLMVSLEKLEEVSEKKKRAILRRKSELFDDEEEEEKDDLPEPQLEEEEDYLLKGMDDEERIVMLGMRRRSISRHDLGAEYEDAIATAKEEADELFLLMEDGRGGDNGHLLKARERSGSLGSRGSFGSRGSLLLSRSGSFRSSGSFMSDASASSFDEDAFYANFIDNHQDQVQDQDNTAATGGDDMDYFFGSASSATTTTGGDSTGGSTGVLVDTPTATGTSESSSAILISGGDSGSAGAGNSHGVSTIDTDNLTVGSLTVTSNTSSSPSININSPKLTASAIAAAKLDSHSLKSSNNSHKSHQNIRKPLPLQRQRSYNSSSLSLTSSIQSECGPPPDWIKWHKRETTKTRMARLQTGYGLALLNVLLDAYGFLLTKKYGVGLSTWEINLVRMGFAAVFMLIVSVFMRFREVFLNHLKHIRRGGRRSGSSSRKSVTIVDGRSSGTKGSSSSSRFSLSGAGSTLLSDDGLGGPWYRMPRMKLRSWLIVSMGVLFVTFLTPALSNYAVFELSLALAVTLISVTPLFTLPLAWLMKGEVPTRRGCLGASLAVMGVIVMCIWGVDSME